MRKIDGLPVPAAIVRAAIQTFVDKGFENASMDEVAARASTTKRTVYAHFRSKDDLFRAALAKAVELFLSELPKLEDVSNPAFELENFAVRFSELCTCRGAVRLQRVTMAESERFPELGAMLHREIIQSAERTIAGYLLRLTTSNSGGPKPDDWADVSARLFLNMSTGPQRFETLLNARQPFEQHPDVAVPPDLDRAFICRAVEMFLAGISKV